jgi:hypothetical protein
MHALDGGGEIFFNDLRIQNDNKLVVSQQASRGLNQSKSPATPSRERAERPARAVRQRKKV